MVATDNTSVVTYINKQGAYQVEPNVCSPLETYGLVPQTRGVDQGLAHPGLPQRTGGFPHQTEWLFNSSVAKSL